MSNILTENQLRAALIAAESEDLVSIVPTNLSFCDQCDRYHDVRSGCEADIRFDERLRIRREFVKWIRSLPNPAIINRDYFLDQLDRICPNKE